MDDPAIVTTQRRVPTVFLSSTSEDLRAHRVAVAEALRGINVHVRKMEDFGARPSGSATTVSLDEVGACDAFDLLVAWRYGTVPDPGGVSISESEYREAKRLKMPTFVFLAAAQTEGQDGPDDLFPAALRDAHNVERVRAFRSDLKNSNLVDWFTTPADLAHRAVQATTLWLMESGLRKPTLPVLRPADFSGTEDGLILPIAAARGSADAADERGMIGRDDLIAWLTERILRDGRAGVYGVYGLGGIGKSSLVATSLDIIKERLTGGLAVVKADGIDQVATVVQILIRKFVSGADDIIRRVGNTNAPLLRALDEALAVIRDGGQRTVVVIDDAQPALVRRPDFGKLLDALSAANVTVVLTAREQLPHLHPDNEKVIGQLSESAAAELFVRLSKRFVESPPTPEQQQEIVAICRLLDGHALATIIAASELQQNPLMTLAEYRELLTPPRHILTADGLGVPALWKVFDRSVRQLSEEARRLFVALGVLASPRCLRDLAIALGVGLGQTRTQALQSLNRLATAHLVTLSGVDVDRPGGRSEEPWIEMHPIPHQFACEMFEGDKVLDAGEKDALWRAMSGYFVAWTQGREYADLLDVSDDVLACVRWARTTGQDADAELTGLCFGMRWFWEDRGEVAAGFELLVAGHDAAERLCSARRRGSRDADRAPVDSWLRMRSRLALTLGRQHQQLGRVDQAQQWCELGFQHARSTRDDVVIAEAISGLAAIALQRGRSRDAKAQYEKALRLFERTTDRKGIADTLYCLGFLALRIGDTDGATDCFERSIGMLTDSPEDVVLQAVNRYSIGNVYHQTGQINLANDAYAKALVVCMEANLSRGQGSILKAIGDLRWLTSGPQAAIQPLESSLSVFRQIFDRQATGVALYSHAFVSRQMGLIDQATRSYEESLQIRKDVGDIRGEGFVLKAIGDLRRRTAGSRSEAGGSTNGLAQRVRDDMREARRLIEAGLRKSVNATDVRNEGVAQKALGDWHWQSGDMARAERCYQQSMRHRERAQDRFGRYITLKALADVQLVAGEVEGATVVLHDCEAALRNLGDRRALGAVRGSLAVATLLRGDLADAEKLIAASRDLIEKVEDRQLLASVDYISACILARSGGSNAAIETLLRSGLSSAEASKAMFIGAVLEEGLGALLGANAESLAEGHELSRRALAVYHGLGRGHDEQRCREALSRTQPAVLPELAVLALMADIDEGPNGQGFAMPNDRRRRGE